MSELSEHEIREALAMVAEVARRDSKSVTHAAELYRLGVEVLKKPESPRLIFDQDLSLLEKADLAEKMASELRMQHARRQEIHRKWDREHVPQDLTVKNRVSPSPESGGDPNVQ